MSCRHRRPSVVTLACNAFDRSLNACSCWTQKASLSMGSVAHSLAEWMRGHLDSGSHHLKGVSARGRGLPSGGHGRAWPIWGLCLYSCSPMQRLSCHRAGKESKKPETQSRCQSAQPRPCTHTHTHTHACDARQLPRALPPWAAKTGTGSRDCCAGLL